MFQHIILFNIFSGYWEHLEVTDADVELADLNRTFAPDV